MYLLEQVDWRKLFIPEQPLLDVVLRGTIMFLVLFLILRLFLRRQAGAIGMADLLVIVLIADAAQNAMGSEYRSVTEGTLLVLTIVFWDYVLDWAGYRIPWLRRFVRPAPLLLIKDGELQHRNLRKEMITREELLSLMREQGVEEPSDVRKAFLEGDGRISIIKRESSHVRDTDKQAPSS
jgi:uncharacterized membrane protein YcaP (DUF421 family)